MKFGVREICDVVLKSKVANLKIGNRTFTKNEPVIYFDSLKTSSVESATTTVYAQGGKGNTRLIAWEGEKTVTFTMEDALLSPLGFSILSGAGIVEASGTDTVVVHASTPVIAQATGTAPDLTIEINLTDALAGATLHADKATVFGMLLNARGEVITSLGAATTITASTVTFAAQTEAALLTDYTILVDYYIDKISGAMQLNIEAGNFAGNYYLEASTLFRDQNGTDLPAEFVIPNVKIQSNFTFTMASTGDPSTFTFTADAFPDYTQWDPTRKVLFAIQVIGEDL